MKLFSLAVASCLLLTAGYAQKEFFRSQQQFSTGELNKFYSSITISGSLILFNANDYTLYAYNKNDGTVKWSYRTEYKTNEPVFVQDSVAYTGIYSETEQSAQVNMADGKLLKTLPFGPLVTKPFIKNGILYGTAIYDFGCMIAYDSKKDTVLWSRFLAHGYSQSPYYFDQSIWANAEGDNWVALNYNGVLQDTSCAEKKNIFIEDIHCVKNFTALSHDGLEIKGALANRIFGDYSSGQPELIGTKKYSFILQDGKLHILGNKLKLKQTVTLSLLSASLDDTDEKGKLIQADDKYVWLLYNDQMLQYNHQTSKIEKLSDLGQWQPHQLLIDEEKIWLISKKDGLLYGLLL